MGTYSYSGTPTKVTINTAGVYNITGYGGQGGTATNDSAAGGAGAEVGGNFNLVQNEVLKLYIGGAG